MQNLAQKTLKNVAGQDFGQDQFQKMVSQSVYIRTIFTMVTDRTMDLIMRAVAPYDTRNHAQDREITVTS